MNWINTIKGKDQLSCDFATRPRLTEIMLLGIVSLRANAKLDYDAATMRITNNVAANQFLTRKVQGGVFAVEAGVFDGGDGVHGFQHGGTELN